MFNQFSGPVDFADHDSSIRPRGIYVVLVLPTMWALALVFVILAMLLQGSSPHAKLSGPELVVLALALLPWPLAFIALVAYGWVSGFLPFVPYPPDTPLGETSVLPQEHPVRLGLTGIVALAVPTIRRRYRNRPSVLVLRGAEINLLVDRWKTEYYHRQASYAAVVSLDPGSVSYVERGTAFLVSREMAEVRLATPQGPLVLTFAAP